MRSLSGHPGIGELRNCLVKADLAERPSLALYPRGERGLVRYIKPMRGIIVFSASIWRWLCIRGGLATPSRGELGAAFIYP